MDRHWIHLPSTAIFEEQHLCDMEIFIASCLLFKKQNDEKR